LILSQNGQLIRVLSNRKFNAGLHQLNWNGKDESGNAVSAGVYTVVMQTSSGRAAKVLIRR